MKKQFLQICALAISLSFFSSCSKFNNPATPATPDYPSSQGKITGTGSASFNTNGSASLFRKTVDTIIVQANIDPTANYSKQFIMGIVAKTPGTINFVDGTNNVTITSGAAAFYRYGVMNSAGTLIDHEFVTVSGTVVINSLSATGVAGTYTAHFADVNNNGDAPITISGTFSGSF